MRTFFRHCSGCGTHRGLTGSLCGTCADELQELGRPQVLQLEGFTCFALAEYSGLFRRLILRAKVKGDHAALAWLETWAARESEDPLAVSRRSLDYSVPVQFVGSFARAPRRRRQCCRGYRRAAWSTTGASASPPALAAFQTARAASRTERASIASALPLRARDYLAVRWSQTYGPRLDEGQILLLDDVATTGQTLVETAQAIGAGASGIRPLLVALAASPKLRDHSLS